MKICRSICDNKILLGMIGSESTSSVEMAIKSHSKKISQLTNIPEEEIIFNNYVDNKEYKKKLVNICAVLILHSQENSIEIISK